MRKLLVCLIFSMLYAPGAAAEQPCSSTSCTPSLRPLVESALSQFDTDSAYAPAVVAFALMDGTSGQLLAERNGTTSVVPASVMKSITTAAALHYLEPDDRFVTRLDSIGLIKEGVLYGDLAIRGGGDPTLGSTRVSGSISSVTLLEKFTSAVVAAGIRKIDGAVLADDSYFPYEPVANGFEWTDIGNYYGAGPTGLCFNDNMYLLTFWTFADVGKPAPIARLEPAMPEIQWANFVTVGAPKSGDQTDIYGGPATLRRWARGTVPKDGREFSVRGSLPDPGKLFARLLCESLQAAGVTVAGGFDSTEGVPAECFRDVARGQWLEGQRCDSPQLRARQELARVESPPLAAIIKTLNKQSFNLYAETLLMHIAHEVKPTTATQSGREVGIANVERFLRDELHVPLQGFSINDGSGLSRTDSVTARGMATFFHGMQSQENFKVWRDSLPHLGVDGDLRKRGLGTALAGKVWAKTGLLGKPRTRSLCGYLQAKSGKVFCFAFIANYYDKPWQEVDKDTDDVLLKLYEGL